jgi:hypothetical protein
MTGKSKATANQVAGQLPLGQGAVNAVAVPCALNVDPQLKVKVWAKVKGKRRQVMSTVTASALSGDSTGAGGIADFSYVLPGTYDVNVTTILAPDDDEFYSPGNIQQITLAKGDKKTLSVEVKPRNIVTPKIELEYKVVLFDPNLAQHESDVHDPSADQLRPEPTRIEVSLSCSEQDPPYTGDGTLDAPGCAVFLDSECQQPLGGRKVTNAELMAGSAMKLYLRGTARGLFTLTLTPDAAADTRFRIEPAATESMGVVALQLQVHEHVTPVAVAATTYALAGYCADLEKIDLIPNQLPLSDADKVQRGRLLHRQSKKHHGRAKALLKLTAGEWPAGTDDYWVVLQTTASEMRAYDDEKEGARLSLPLKTTVSNLKAADKEVWVEGAHSSLALRSSRLSLGLDRGSGGLSKKTKTNADWTRFTIVKIESVKLEYTEPAAGNPKPWDPRKQRWFINYQAGDAGRTITLRAKLSKKIAGIKLHFMLCPDKDNLKEKNWGVDLPDGPHAWDWNLVGADVKQKDKLSTTSLLHKSENTNAEGLADCKIILSQFGGDRFVPAAYITQDPHLAAYVHDHNTLKERKPKLADAPINVWRKFAYQKVKVTGLKAYPSTTAAENAYGRVRAKMLKRPSVYVSQSTVQAWPRASLLPEYMFKVNGSKKLKLNVSDQNQAQFFALVNAEAEHPIKVSILTGDFNWGNETNSGPIAGLDALPVANFPLDVDVQIHVCDPPVQGGPMVVAGSDWTARDWDAAANGGVGDWVNVRQGLLAAGDVDINPNRASINRVRLKLPAGVGATTPETRLWFNLDVNGAPDDYLGGYNPSTHCIVALYDPRESADYQDTLVHELGHAFDQVAGGNQVTPAGQPPAAGIPLHPHVTFDAVPGYEGTHCDYPGGACVMYTSGPQPGALHRFCPDCHPYLLVQDMSSLS